LRSAQFNLEKKICYKEFGGVRKIAEEIENKKCESEKGILLMNCAIVRDKSF